MVAHYGGVGDKRYERATPQSTALTAPLDGSQSCLSLRRGGPLAVVWWLFYSCDVLILATPQPTLSTAPLKGSLTGFGGELKDFR